MRKKIILPIICFVVSSVFAQEMPKISPPPPDVYSLYKFTEIPVSHTTGIPNINVPIYEIKLNNFTLPISINYHSSGVLIDEIASDIGLGWSLNAGGMITQIALGEPDFGNGVVFPQNDVLDDTGPSLLINSYNNEEYNILRELSAENTEQNGMDTQPDVYMFNIGNFNGKFFFDLEGNAHTIPKSDIKIIRNNNLDYTIIDDKGNQYFYSTIARNLNYSYFEYSSNGLGASSHSENYSLYLTKIETTNNEKIYFEYNTVTYKYKNPDYLKRSKRQFDNTGLTACTPIINVPDINNLNSWIGFEFEKNEKYSNYVEVSSGKSLSKISVNNGQQIIYFEYNDCPRLDLPSEPLTGNTITTGSFALKNIKIKNSILGTVDYFNLIHEYFNLTNYQACVTNSNITNRDSYRLKLKEIIKNNIEIHRFEYFENQLLPNRLSNYYDHWNRFKTNIIGNGSYVLDYSYSFLDGVNRNPHLESSQLGTLKKIIYPTKGYTEFIYGLNKTYGSYKLYNPPLIKNSSIFLTGTEELGIPNEEQHLTLPVTINNLASDDLGIEIKPTIRIYSPPIDSDTGYTLDNFYTFYLVNNNNVNQTISFLYNDQNGQPQSLNISNGNYTLHIIGKHEGLGAIIEWTEDTTQQNVTENIDIGGLRIEQINNKDNNNSVESTKIFKYNFNDDVSRSSGIVINLPVYTFKENKYRVCSIVTSTTVQGGTYNSNSFINYVYTSQQNKPHFPMSLLNGYHIMYPEIQVFNNENKQNGYSTFKYSFIDDFSSYSVNSGGFSSENFICPPTSLDFLRGDLIEKIDYKKTDTGFIKVTENKYDYFHNELGPFFNNTNNNYRIGLKLEEFFKEVIVMRTTGGGELQIPDAIYPSLFNLGYYKLQSVKKYLSKSTEIIYDSYGNNPVTRITNYNYSNLIHNQLTSQTTNTSFSDTLKTVFSYAHEMNNQAMIAKNMIGIPLKTETFKNGEKISTQETVYKNWGNNLLAPEIIKTAKGNLPVEDRIKYTILDNTNGNPIEIEQVGGVKIIYIWGYNKTQPIAKIENATYASVQGYEANLQSLSNGADEQGLIAALNNLRTVLPNAMVTTYTYKPLVGINTVTDPKGDKQTYHYDSFNRLQFVKDAQGNILSENQYHYRTQN